MFYTEEFLIENLELYSKESGLTHKTMDPDDFVKWVFPKLLDYRKTKYEFIAKNYGYKVIAVPFDTLTNRMQFIKKSLAHQF